MKLLLSKVLGLFQTEKEEIPMKPFQPTDKKLAVICIAGTSSGNYAHRILAACNETGGRGEVKILIGKGVKQESVHTSVRKSILDLNTFLLNHGQNCRIKFTIKLLQINL